MKDMVRVGEELHEIEKMIDSYEHASAESWLKACWFWKTIHDTEIWRAGGTHLNNFRDYIRDRGRKVSTVYRGMLIVSGLEGFNLAGGIPAKLYHIARARKKLGLDNPTTLKLIEYSKNEKITEDAVRNFIREIEGKVTTDACEHLNTEAFNRCKACGKWLREMDANITF